LEAHEFYTSSSLSVSQVEEATKVTKMDLLEQIRPHAVCLVDAWKLPDWLLDSSLGRYDGKVYEDMFHRASQLNSLNKVVADVRPDSNLLIRGEGDGTIKSML
jgi:acyl-CoA oxidase